MEDNHITGERTGDETDDVDRRRRELDVANDCAPGAEIEPPGEPAHRTDDPDST